MAKKDVKPQAVWVPNPGSQFLFASCPALEVLIEGTRGGGKTDALLMDFASGVGRGWGSNWRGILFRRTFPQLSDVVAKSRKWFSQAWPKGGCKWNSATYTWTWDSGEQLLFRYIRVPDDYWNYHGHEYPWIGFEELTNWPTPECYEAMRSCSRCSVQGIPRKIRSTANPYGVGHNWVKNYFIDVAKPGVTYTDQHGNQRVTIHSSYKENIALMTADPGYESRLAADSNEMRRRAWMEGDWDVVAGGMFDDVWDRTVHIVNPFKIPPTWKINRSFDWGSSAPFSVIWWAESNGEAVKVANGDVKCYPRGTLFAIAEDYGWNGQPNKGCSATSTEIARRVKRIEGVIGLNGRSRPGPADSAIFAVIDGRSIASEMELAGCRWDRAAKGAGSRVAGWERMRDMMEAATKTPMERPGLFVFANCQHWIRTVPTLPRDSGNPDDVDSEAEDHCGDATRYRVAGMDRRVYEREIHGI